MDIDWIRRELADRRVGVVAAKTGISRVTVARIRDGKETNPKLETMRALAAYLAGEGAIL